MLKHKKSHLTIILSFCFLIFLLWGHVSQAQTQTQENLYEVQVDATAQKNQEDQNALIRQGFKELLMRLTASEKILMLGEVEAAIAEVDRYVKQFSYHIPPQTALTSGRILKIKFSEILVKELLQHLNKEIVSSNRHPVLIWIVTTENNQSEWVGGELQPAVLEGIQMSAKNMGLSLVFPLMDLNDTDKISTTHVLNQEIEPILEASKRYQANRVLLLKLTKESTESANWKADWTLLENGDKDIWHNFASDLKIAIRDGLENLAPKIASTGINSNTALQTANDQKLQTAQNISLIISGIMGLEQYAQILEYLRKLPEVNAVEVAEIKPNQTIFTVETTANQEVLRQSITRGSFLVADDSLVADAPAEETHKLKFKIVGVI